MASQALNALAVLKNVKWERWPADADYIKGRDPALTEEVMRKTGFEIGKELFYTLPQTYSGDEFNKWPSVLFPDMRLTGDDIIWKIKGLQALKTLANLDVKFPFYDTLQSDVAREAYRRVRTLPSRTNPAKNPVPKRG
ncbi:MAG: hypothetical protein WC464_03235 [Bdellovibrionales bacterium]